ncbi:probable ATP-dependent RNA helicase spindle-E [Contarinia nasturtii]|uniref:probable ATP-dependent RNA helicase spindle-E n=1 Tax=Contarinia nasturtii TaxID=265458 RepID=UPI0012D3D627|nr:probable ATP-dependent RNA helicase spindle-E [Contarinia nasturtii]
MDFLDIMFSKGKPFTPISVTGGSTNGRVKAYIKPLTIKTRLLDDEKDMFEDDIEETRQRLKKNLERMGEIDVTDDNFSDDVYTKYNFNTRTSNGYALPIYSSKRDILENVSKFQSVVIEADTGCGKSTQVPQMILDEARKNQKACNIIVTQPRRIAARSIAERVAAERGWDLGTVVGYQVGLDKKFVSEDTRILFCTTGVLLEKLIQSKSLSGFTHIILDEVHERDKDMDFLFIIIRMLMAKEITSCKVILMSATINSKMFANYFECYENGKWAPAPIVKVDKKNLYKVKVYYLDDLDGVQVTGSLEQPGISDDMYKLVLTIIRRINVVCPEPDDRSLKLSSILIFLPGIYEIGQMRNFLTEFAETKGDLAWKIYILHSLVSTEEQQSIFQPVEDGVRKIILSTNIAESSITVPDVKFVIDFCLMKYLHSDSTKNFTSLEMAWASRNNCRQRAGRAGRLEDGRCYRLVYRRHFERYMRESQIPELRLTPLENAILKAKTFEMESPHMILGQAMEDSKPEVIDIANTVLSLKELGALLLTYKDEGYIPVDGDLTFLGRVMANLPIDVRATRMIALGYCYGVLEECVIMAAGLTAKSIFKITFERDLSEYTRRLEWSNGSGSDLFAILNAYKVWTLKYNQKEFGKKSDQLKAERDFCNKHCLDVRSLHECHLLIQELTQRLDKLGIYQATGLQGIHWTEQEKSIILKVVIAGAFYPNFYGTAPITNPIIERDLYHALNGRDPNNTVYFTGFRQDHIRELYVDSIRNLFLDTVVSKEDLDGVKISFDASEKVFVTFERLQDICDNRRNDWDTKQCSIPGKALTEVYKAVKMRKINLPTSIGVMKIEKDIKMAEDIGLGVMSGSTFVLKKNIRDEIGSMCIPSVIKKEVVGKITYVEHCSKFWFQPKSEEQCVENFKRILNENSNGIIDKLVDCAAVTREQIIVARDHCDNKLYRARLVAWEYDCFTLDYKHALVCFIDYGHTQKCSIDELFVFTCDDNDLATMPPRCFQCRLANIQANTANISGGNLWDHDAISLFKQLVFDVDVTVKIYSVVNGVVNGFIFLNGTNMNDRLIYEQYGVFCEETYLSMDNYLKRQRVQEDFELDMIDESALEMDDCGEYYPIANVESIKPVEDIQCSRIVRLKGPHSPLETQVYSMLVQNEQQSITVDPHSVNSVFLNSMQQDLCLKYMVASHISTTDIKSNKGFIIHETTTLPNIRGFGALMAMTFCPAMDLKRDDWKSRYVSVRTGLGFNDERNQPYYPEHDVVFPLDFNLEKSDIELINQIRYSIGELLHQIGKNVCNDTLAPKNKLKLMKKVKELTLELITKNREPIEINHGDHEWKEYDCSEFEPFKDFHVGKAIFPPHGVPRLMPMDKNAKRQLQKHCANLHSMKVSMPRATMCELCATQIENVTMLRTHLMTRLHLTREDEIGFKRL